MCTKYPDLLCQIKSAQHMSNSIIILSNKDTGKFSMVRKVNADPMNSGGRNKFHGTALLTHLLLYTTHHYNIGKCKNHVIPCDVDPFNTLIPTGIT